MKIVDIKATTWTREDLPGYHVRYSLPDDAVVTIDGAAHNPQVDTSKITAGGGKPYVSEIATALLGHWKTDAAGNLVDGNTGAVLTVATPDDPWPAVIDGIQELLQFQIEHNNRIDQVYVDGAKIGQPGIDPGVRYGSANNPGKLTLEFSPPVAVIISAPAATGSDPAHIMLTPPANHQVDVVLHGAAIITLTDLPAPAQPGRMGFFRLTDMAGQQMPTGTVIVTDAAGTELTRGDAQGFACWIAVGAPVNGQTINVQPGSTIVVQALGLSSDVLGSYRSADW